MAQADGSLVFDTKVDTTGAETGVSSLKTIFKTGIAALVAKQAYDITKMGVAYNAQMEQYMTSFEVMLGSADKASKHVADLKKMAAKTPFEMEDLASASQQLMAFGVDVKDIQPDLKMLGDISMGNKERFKGLALVFGQVQSQGKLMGQDLLQMINQGFNPLQVISEKTGESMASLKDKMSKGQITFEDVTEAMKIATSEGGKFYQGMEKQSETLTGRISTLKDNVKSLLGELTKPAFNFISENVMPKLMKGIDWMLNNLPMVQGIIAGIGSAIATAFAINKFTAIIKSITEIGGAVKTFIVANPWMLVAAAVIGLVTAITVFLKTGGSIEQFGKKITTKITTFAKKVPQLIKKMLATLIAHLPEILQAGVQIIMALVTGLIQAIPSLIQALPQIIVAIVQAFVEAWPEMKQAGWELLQVVGQGILSFVETLWSWVLRVAKELPKKMRMGLGSLFTIGANWLKSLWEGYKSWISWITNKIYSFATGLFKNVKSGLGSLFSAGYSWLSGLWDGITSWTGWIASRLYSFATGLPRQIASGLGSLFSIGADWLRGLWNGIASVKDWIISKVKGIGGTIIDSVRNVFEINSPSKVMMRIGYGVGEGLGLGVEKSTPTAVKPAVAQAEAVVEAYDKQAMKLKTQRMFGSALNNIRPMAVNTGKWEIEGKSGDKTVYQTININEPVKTPAETARVLRKEAITLGLAGGAN